MNTVSRLQIAETLRSGSRVVVTFVKRDGSLRVLTGMFDPAGEAENKKPSEFVVMKEEGKPEGDNYRHVNVNTVVSVLLTDTNTLVMPHPPKEKKALPRKAVTRSEIAALARSGAFITVTFARKDGVIRELNGRHGVAKFTKGGERTTDPDKYLIIWESGHEEGAEGYRNVAIERIISLVHGGVEYYPQ